MKDLKETLITKKSIKNIVTSIKNKFGITEEDLVGDISKFPIGVVVRMLEETELQGNKPNIIVFQRSRITSSDKGGFSWGYTEDGYDFWNEIIEYEKFNIFYKRYPDYKKYDR